MPKVFYGVAAVWLNTAEQRKLDGFQNRCLRAIWGIKPAFVSRVSNARVLEITGQQLASRLLKKQMLLLYGRVARQCDGDAMRSVTFCCGTLRPAVDEFVRKVGRPRLNWTTQVGDLGLQAAGGPEALQAAIADERAWRCVVESF